MFSGQPPTTPGQFSAQQLLRMVFLIGVGFAIFLLVPVFIFVSPYHAIRERTAQYDASPHCREGVTLAVGATPCTIEWANVLKRYYTSGSGKSSHHYYYYLWVRGGYGDEHRIELKNEMVFWRTRNGDALKLQRWGDSITSVQLASGESSETNQNPDWQLRNEIRGLHTLLIFELFAIAIAVAGWIGLRQIYG